MPQQTNRSRKTPSDATETAHLQNPSHNTPTPAKTPVKRVKHASQPHTTTMKMTTQRIQLSTANQFINSWHRHAKPVIGHLHSIGLFDENLTLHGIAIIGRPVNRHLDNGHTAEITRLATDGTPNACSKLYAAARHYARQHGYQRLITYTLATEPGTSLKASGFTLTAHTKGRQWDTPTRRRKHRPTPDRHRWETTP